MAKQTTNQIFPRKRYVMTFQLNLSIAYPSALEAHFSARGYQKELAKALPRRSLSLPPRRVVLLHQFGLSKYGCLVFRSILLFGIWVGHSNLTWKIIPMYNTNTAFSEKSGRRRSVPVLTAEAQHAVGKSLFEQSCKSFKKSRLYHLLLPKVYPNKNPNCLASELLLGCSAPFRFKPFRHRAARPLPPLPAHGEASAARRPTESAEPWPKTALQRLKKPWAKLKKDLLINTNCDMFGWFKKLIMTFLDYVPCFFRRCLEKMKVRITWDVKK